jgi:hypothetical protein
MVAVELRITDATYKKHISIDPTDQKMARIFFAAFLKQKANFTGELLGLLPCVSLLILVLRSYHCRDRSL